MQIKDQFATIQLPPQHAKRTTKSSTSATSVQNNPLFLYPNIPDNQPWFAVQLLAEDRGIEYVKQCCLLCRCYLERCYADY